MQSSFQFYSSGVLTSACGDNIDHAILAVGYGTSNGIQYYKVCVCVCVLRRLVFRGPVVCVVPLLMPPPCPRSHSVCVVCVPPPHR